LWTSDVAALLVQVLMELLDLLLRDLDLLQGGRDLLEGEGSALLAFGDQLTQVVHLPDGCLVSE
jgi:hypothetical protein